MPLMAALKCLTAAFVCLMENVCSVIMPFPVIYLHSVRDYVTLLSIYFIIL